MLKQQKQFPVKAIIRIRPGNNFLEHTEKTIRVEKVNGAISEFQFDKVLGPKATQSQVFNTIKEELLRFREGYNITIFCYGNTGAGKTYTMIGTQKQRGLVYNVLNDLLNKEKETLTISYLEIYNEKVYDLLDSKELQLREANGVIVVPELSTRKIKCIEEFESVLKIGNENRTTGETKLNKFSSRSHSILRIQRGETKLHLIDLAGSENNRKTGNEGVRLTESSNINRSLFVLAKVVNSIINKEIRIPYRDSKLTRLLQDSLGGNSVCCIIANVNDDSNCIGDTINTLSFASKSKKIVNLGSKITETKQVVKQNTSNKLVFHKKMTSTPLVDKTNERIEVKTSIKRRTKENSTLSIGSSFCIKPDIVLTPSTKEKSYKAFLKRAQEYEEVGRLKEALDDYKTIQKFNESPFIEAKIESLTGKLRNTKKKVKVSRREVLDILNSGNFVNIKRISCIGDKRAQSIVEFIAGGNFFESLEDLRLIFTEKVVSRIISYVE